MLLVIEVTSGECNYKLSSDNRMPGLRSTDTLSKPFTDNPSRNPALRLRAGAETTGNSHENLLVGFAVLIHLFIAVPLAYSLNIWTDEAFTLDTTGKNLGYALSQSIHFEIQAPLYFLALNLWQHINQSLFFARLFSVICVALTIVFISILAKQLFRNIRPSWIAFWLAVHPFTLWAATEIRLYAFAMLLASLLILLFFQGFRTDAQPQGYRLAYLVVAVAALYTHYYLGFILVANAFVLLVNRRWRSLGQYVLYMALAGVCFVPMMSFVVAQGRSTTTADSHPLRLLTAFSRVIWQIKEFILPVASANPQWLRRWIFRAAYVTVGIMVFRNGRRLLSRTNSGIYALVLVVSFFFVLALRSVPEGFLIERHMVSLFLPVVLLTSCLINNAGRIWRPIALSILIFFSAWSSYENFKSVAKEGDWQRVSLFLQMNEHPDETILVFHAGAALPLSHYYHGVNRLVALPNGNRTDRFDLHDYVLHDEGEIRAAVGKQTGDTVWMVTDGKCGYAGVNFNCPLLEEFIQREFDVTATVGFKNSLVRKLRRKNR